jgi:predicted DNA-binding transcriptional regulator AlpA
MYPDVAPKPEAELLGPGAVSRMLGVCSNTLHKIADGDQFPAPAIVGARKKWLRTEVNAYLRNRCRMPSEARGTSSNRGEGGE